MRSILPVRGPAAAALAAGLCGAAATPAAADTGGHVYAPEPAVTLAAPAARAALAPDGRTALAPAGAPTAVVRAIAAANRIARKPYKWGGGHRRWRDSGYDCSGTVSYVLHGAGLLGVARDSTGLMAFGRRGPGRWITVKAHGGHAYMIVAGLRFDTSGRGEEGPRWRPEPRSGRGYATRHPAGL